jgi:choline kinase/phosphatidylglycerophosphate synthase
MYEANMKTLILAAGDGTRMRSMSSKVILPLHGVPLIQRTVLTLKDAGITDMIVVVGFEADSVKNCLGDGSKYGVRINYVINEEWEGGNASSILRAERLVDEKFLLIMGDHVFTPDIIKGILRIEGGLVVATDSDPRYVDVGEATKILIKAGEIKGIGKGLRKFNAVDTGIFLCSKNIFPVVKECVKHGREEWSDSVGEYAKNHRVVSYDASASFWFDVDTKEDLEKAEVVLLKSLIKPSDGFISKNLNRKISTRISKYLVNTGITPNQMTLISFLTALISTTSFSFGVYIYVAVGGVLAQLASILDGCDGEIARLKFAQSSYGSWLDACLDRYADFLIILGMAYGYWIVHKDVFILFIGFLCIAGSFMMAYTPTRYEEAFKEKFKSKGIRIPMGRDVRLFIVFLTGISNQILYSLILLAILTNLVTVTRFTQHRKERAL